MLLPYARSCAGILAKLISARLKLCPDTRRLEARVFGAAHRLSDRGGRSHVIFFAPTVRPRRPDRPCPQEPPGSSSSPLTLRSRPPTTRWPSGSSMLRSRWPRPRGSSTSRWTTSPARNDNSNARSGLTSTCTGRPSAAASRCTRVTEPAPLMCSTRADRAAVPLRSRSISTGAKVELGLWAATACLRHGAAQGAACGCRWR